LGHELALKLIGFPPPLAIRVPAKAWNPTSKPLQKTSLRFCPILKIAHSACPHFF
jgi:hypothetical protein